MTQCYALVLGSFCLLITSCDKNISNSSADQFEDGSSELARQAVSLCAERGAQTLTLRDKVGPDLLPGIARLSNLTSLEIYQANFQPNLLAEFQTLSDLRVLRLEDLPLADEHVQYFRHLPNIEILNLPASRLTDRGVIELLKYLPKLELIRLGSPHLSDASLRALSEVATLRFLHLEDCPITDRGLAALHPMHALESFYLDGGEATEEGIRDLLLANPGLHFHLNQTHVDEDPNADDHDLVP